MKRTFQRELQSSRESLAEAAVVAAAWLEAEEIPAPAALLARLAIDELVSNVIKYGYDDDAGHAIEVEFVATERDFEIRVVDDGRAFNPLEATAPVLDAAVDERKIGGLGLHLLRELSDCFTYERRGSCNHVTLVKVYGP